jgi:hypothetical protein
MDGSSSSLILIPIVVSISLAAWLILVFYADSHPRPDGDSPATGHAKSSLTATTGGRWHDAHPAERAARKDKQRWPTGQYREPPRPGQPHPLRQPASAKQSAPTGQPPRTSVVHGRARVRSHRNTTG